jgi:hypothetical protein
VVVVAPAHPLCGERVVAKSFRRRDGELQLVVVLPDGSPGLMPAGVTDVFGTPEPTLGPGTVLSVEGVRCFRSLLAAKAPPAGSRRRRARPWKVVRHAHGSDPFDCREWVYSCHTTELAAGRARDRLRAVMVRASGYAAAAKWAWSVVNDPAGVVFNPPVDTAGVGGAGDGDLDAQPSADPERK